MKGNDYYLQTAAVCHRGAVRPGNEDNLYYGGGILNREHGDMAAVDSRIWFSAREGWLAGVFDGMGGYSHGEFASYLAAVTTKQNAVWLNGFQPDIPTVLKDICLQANNAVCRQMESSVCKMGTTASLLFFRGDSVWVCNIGDSPVYCFRQGTLLPFYEEHTERVIYQQLKGKAVDKKRKFPLTQHIGIFQDEMVIEPYVKKYLLQDGDVFLACTDGMTDMLDEGEIVKILNWKTSAGEIAEQLKKAALKKGGADNITLIVIRVKRRGR